MNEKYHYRNLYLPDDTSDKNIDRNIYNGKTFLFFLKNNTFEHYCIHIDENKNYTEFMQHDDLMNYAKNKCSEYNSVIKSDCEYECFKLTCINGKTIDLASNTFCINYILYALHMAYRVAECIKDAIKLIRNDIVYVSASDIHSDLAYYFAIMLVNNMNTITVDECVIVNNKKRVHITFSSNDKNCIPTILIGDYITPGALKFVSYNGAIPYFCDMFLLEFIKYEAIESHKMVVSKSKIISHPFLLCGNHDSWIDQPESLISDLYFTIDGVFYYFRHSFLRTDCMKAIPDVPFYKMYSTNHYEFLTNGITFHIHFLKYVNSHILFIKTREKSLHVSDTLEQFNELYDKDELLNNITYGANRMLNDLNMQNIKKFILIIGHDALYNVLNMAACTDLDFHKIKALISDFTLEYPSNSKYYEENPFVYSKYNRLIHTFKLDYHDVNFSFICTDDFHKSIFKPCPFAFTESIIQLSLLKILQIFDKHHINEILPYSLTKNRSIVDKEYKENTIQEYIKYIRVYKDFVKSLTHDDIMLIRKAIAPKYVCKRFNVSALPYFNPSHAYKNGETITDLDKFEILTSHNTSKILQKTDNVFMFEGDPYNVAALSNVASKSYLRYQMHIPRTIFMFDNVLCATHSFQDPVAANRYGNEIMILDLEKLIANDVHVSVTGFDRGVYYDLQKYMHLCSLPTCVINNVIQDVKNKNISFLDKIHDIYFNEHSDDELLAIVQKMCNINDAIVDEMITKSMFTDELSDDQWKYIIFKLFIVIYTNKLNRMQDANFIYKGLIEIFSSNYLSNVDKLFISHAGVSSKHFYMEYTIDLNGDLSKYFENLKIHSPKIDNLKLYKSDFFNAINAVFDIKEEANIIKLLTKITNSAAFNEGTLYKWFNYIYAKHLTIGIKKDIAAIFDTSFHKASDAFTTVFLKLVNFIYMQHKDLLEFEQFTSDQIKEMQNILDTHSKKIIESIVKVISNDKFDFIYKNSEDLYAGDTFYYFFDEKYVSEYPTQYSLFWYKDIYNNSEAIYSTLSGGNITNKRQNSFVIAIILAVVLLVIGLIVYYCSTINWYEIVDYSRRYTRNYYRNKH